MNVIKQPKLLSIMAFALLSGLFSLNATAAEYKIDTLGMHAFIEFKVSHLGFSLLGGRFDKFEGNFSWDKDNPAASSVEVTVQTDSVSTNHAERDKHLRSADFLNTKKHPTAKFVSTGYQGNANGGVLKGNFTLNGVTKPITIEMEHIGQGKDPWGGYRAGFAGKTSLKAEDFGYTNPIFPRTIDITMSVEGIRQK